MNRDGNYWMRLVWTMLAFVACSWQVRPFLKTFRPAEVGCPDFFQEWASARNWSERVPIYSPQAASVDRYRDSLHIAPGTPTQSEIEYNAHPPTSVLLAMPLARLDFPDAFLAWSLASILALCITIAIIVWQCPKALTPWAILPLAALLLLCSPFRQQVFQGQLNLVLLLLITAAWAADRCDRPWLAGIFIAAAAAIKLVPGYLFLYFAARRQWRPLVAGAAGFLVLTAVTVLVLGPASYRDYVTIVLPALAKWRLDVTNASLAGFWDRLFNSQGSHVIPLWQNPALAWTATIGSDAIVTSLTAWCVWRCRSLCERDLTFSLTAIAMLLVSPITWFHYFTLLFLPLFLVWHWAPPTRWSRPAFWLLVVGLWLHPLVYWKLVIPGVTYQNWLDLTVTPRQSITGLSMQTYVLLALFAFTILVIHRLHRDEGIRIADNNSIARVPGGSVSPQDCPAAPS
jgi:hypothetical protein